jgi:hypothetical protein
LRLFIRWIPLSKKWFWNCFHPSNLSSQCISSLKISSNQWTSYSQTAPKRPRFTSPTLLLIGFNIITQITGDNRYFLLFRKFFKSDFCWKKYLFQSFRIS